MNSGWSLWQHGCTWNVKWRVLRCFLFPIRRHRMGCMVTSYGNTSGKHMASFSCSSISLQATTTRAVTLFSQNHVLAYDHSLYSSFAYAQQSKLKTTTAILVIQYAIHFIPFVNNGQGCSYGHDAPFHYNLLFVYFKKMNKHCIYSYYLIILDNELIQSPHSLSS